MVFYTWQWRFLPMFLFARTPMQAFVRMFAWRCVRLRVDERMLMQKCFSFSWFAYCGYLRKTPTAEVRPSSSIRISGCTCALEVWLVEVACSKAEWASHIWLMCRVLYPSACWVPPDREKHRPQFISCLPHRMGKKTSSRREHTCKNLGITGTIFFGSSKKAITGPTLLPRPWGQGRSGPGDEVCFVIAIFFLRDEILMNSSKTFNQVECMCES